MWNNPGRNQLLIKQGFSLAANQGVRQGGQAQDLRRAANNLRAAEGLYRPVVQGLQPLSASLAPKPVSKAAPVGSPKLDAAAQAVPKIGPAAGTLKQPHQRVLTPKMPQAGGAI